MIERNRIGQELREEFGVLGSTGNVWADVPIYNTLHWQMTPGIHGKNWKATLLLLWVWRQDMSPLLTIFILGPDALKGNHCKHIVSKIRPRINWTSNADWLRISSYSSSWKVVRTNIGPLFLYWAIFASFASSSTLYALVSKVSVKAFQERNALTITRMQGPPLEWIRWDLP